MKPMPPPRVGQFSSRAPIRFEVGNSAGRQRRRKVTVVSLGAAAGGLLLTAMSQIPSAPSAQAQPDNPSPITHRPSAARQTRGSRTRLQHRDTVGCVADDDILEQRIVDDVAEDMQRYVSEHSPDQIHIPDSISDDEATLAVQHEHEQAGFECLVEQAREIVREARSHSS